jgi:hypothetical protein
MIESDGGFVSQMGRWAVAAASATCIAAVAMLASASSAQAGLQQEFAVFAQCPVNAPNVITCAYSTTSSGEFTLGSKSVQINKTVTLQGGISSTSPDLVPAANGETLSKTPLTVPGGLTGIDEIGGEVTATAELAGPVEINGANVLKRSGVGVSLPLEVKLDNSVLGEQCYIGSASEPVNPHLTTGTTNPPSPNTPISGSIGALTFAAGHQITILPTTLVDNAFSVPGANGCGAVPLVTDELVDVDSGLPAEAGHNTAIMTGVLETTPAAAVRAQAALPEIGRCVIAESTGEGKNKVYHGVYEDPGCTAEVLKHEGKYEWLPATKDKFTGKSTAWTLEGAHGGGVKCSSSSLTGEYTGPKAAVASLTLKGCKSLANKQACESTGAKAGEILAGGLSGNLGFIQDEATSSGSVIASVGLDLSHEPSLLAAQCGGASEGLTVKGSVIAPISVIDKMSKTLGLAYSASGGKQSPEAFEGGPTDTLSATLGSGAEQAGVSTNEKITNEELLEVKAIAQG